MSKAIFMNRWVAPVLSVLVVLGVAVPGAFAAEGQLTSLIDFGDLATKIQPLLSTAIQAAAGVGAVVLAATVCWRFFKRFIRG